MGNDQSSYFGRCTSSTSRPGRNVTTPAAWMSGGGAERVVGTALVSHLPPVAEEHPTDHVDDASPPVHRALTGGPGRCAGRARRGRRRGGRLAGAVGGRGADADRRRGRPRAGGQRADRLDRLGRRTRRARQRRVGRLDRRRGRGVPARRLRRRPDRSVRAGDLGVGPPGAVRRLPASLEWELFAQSSEAALLFLGLPASLDLAALEDDLEALGYARPDADDGVWVGGGEVTARVGGVTEQLGHLVLDADRRLLVASDSQIAAERWRDGQRGTARDDGVADVVAEIGGAVSATVYTGDHACVALSMTQASDDDRVRAADLVEAAGGVHPLLGFAIAGRPGGEVRVAMAFDTEEQARADADARFALARGPAPGQGTDFPDLFELGEGDVAARGSVVTMDLDPLPYAFALSDLAQGPVLFATC
ncbi:hypothetical protein [Nocardioides sp. TF02-7]|uniref:hypothetical protein n=1 Tax=Nocardioides sp. TF02-7 TaxID=2917724 RepID=UPI001F0568DF|nr:hypothetical protein [Nocardioides sp. TF02-7]UMG91090.1 hypothetical protein MF408_12840 [Nocardioides sp. TF02-7]